MTLFLYGTLRHRPLLTHVLGRDPGELPSGVLAGHEVRGVDGQRYPGLATGGGDVPGLLLDVTPQERARLDYYEGGTLYAVKEVEVSTGDGPVRAEVYMPGDRSVLSGDPWDLDAWVARWAAATVESAVEIMERFEAGQPVEDMIAVHHGIEARGWIRAELVKPAPTEVRGSDNPVDITSTSTGYDGFFRMRRFTFRHRRFDGALSPELGRECFVSFDATLILPYDPATDQVLLIEQLRFGPLMRGDPHPLVLEPVAGMVDAGETPEEGAVREAIEEAGLGIREVLPISSVYSSPGYNTDYFHCFLGLADLSGADQRLGGAEEEHEDIKSHVMSFDRAMALVDSGEINVGPLVMMLLWLARHRERLRASG
ncbi:gamma-glutamylcyclotransferase [Pelagovum pacificum]|uniref:Putative gamma-glutamylcyclotransferase n=1 Tax=Pelagovum pacificum TaxID=2588711 RepID=A0A5C5G8C7_9RHOB|nr:gamma-glutamylcyclotransferase [Pelagovum pacificum]QQA41531.1 gamma-glutamylcyclotransferase [Pelagovum pacificum]TNY30811.1 NUDIX domain-containing protein [Pelagovum pacificum]